jgi:hypothetical protein
MDDFLEQISRKPDKMKKKYVIRKLLQFWKCVVELIVVRKDGYGVLKHWK